MAKYCITAANHDSSKDDRASHFKVWEYKQNDQKNWVWSPLGKKTLNYVASLLAAGHQVLSGKEVKKDGVVVKISTGAEIELGLRIAKNDEDFKITDLPKFQ